jgi:hypothetical protein
MKLTTDDHFRLRSRVLFKPKQAYDVEKQPDGSILIRELVPKEPEPTKLAKTRAYRGIWLGERVADKAALKESILRAIQADREERQ